MQDELSWTDSLARGLQHSARTEGWLQDEHAIAAARFRFEESARSFAANLLVGSPQEDDAFAERYLCLLKGLQREKRLNDSALHVKCSWAIPFTFFPTESHFRACAHRLT